MLKLPLRRWLFSLIWHTGITKIKISKLTKVKTSGRLWTLDHIPHKALRAVCAQDWLHDQSRARAAKMTSAPTHTPHTTLFLPELWQNAPLAGCLWEEFGSRNGWMEGLRGLRADKGSNSSWACYMQVQMQVTHRTSPCFQATKETGRDLSGQHFGLWRQHDQMTPSRT